MRPIATDGVAWSVCQSVGHDREPCKSGWTDHDAFQDVDLGGPKEPCIRWGPDPDTWSSNFEGKKGLAQDMSKHVQWSIYSKQLSRGQHRYGADDADWSVLDGGEHWLNLANTIELSMYGSDTALHQITLTSCCFWPRLLLLNKPNIVASLTSHELSMCDFCKL